MKFTTVTDAKKQTGLSYLGMVNSSVKHLKNYKYAEMVYALYLAPASLSGYNVCPMSNAECRALCLNESGRNKMDVKQNRINNARIIKTKLFFEHREFFMQWLIADIIKYKKVADKEGYHFSVRLNNTSDINPESFYIRKDEKTINILQMFPDIQFYDYTKVPNRVELVKKYNNYDLTFSFDGYNWNVCTDMLKNNVRVAAVFKYALPDVWNGVKVIDGDLYDTRFIDERNVIVGLKFKQVRNKLHKDVKFVIQ
jgi:hypothetical protein